MTKKMQRQLFIKALLLLGLAGFLFLKAYCISEDFPKWVPAAIELYGCEGISLSQVMAFQSSETLAAAFTGQQGTITKKEGEAPVPVWYQSTTANYGTLAGLRLTEGSYFSDDTEVQNAVVLPKSLARQLFATGSALQQSLYIQNTEAKVCGVYEDENLLVQLASASVPVVYGNFSTDSNIVAEQLLVAADALKTAEQQKQETAVLLDTPLDGKINDLLRMQQLSKNLLGLACFFAGLYFVLQLGISFCKNTLCAYDSPKSSKQRKRRILYAVGAFGLCVGLFALLLQLVRIPSCYLPEENIFELSHYGKLILARIRQIHSDGRILDFSRIGMSFLIAEALCLLPAVFLCWDGFWKLQQLLRQIHTKQ